MTATEPSGRPIKLREYRREFAAVALALRSQYDGSMPPLEKRDPQDVLEHTDLVADRGLGNAKLFGSLRKTHVTGRDLKCANG